MTAFTKIFQKVVFLATFLIDDCIFGDFEFVGVEKFNLGFVLVFEEFYVFLFIILFLDERVSYLNAIVNNANLFSLETFNMGRNPSLFD